MVAILVVVLFTVILIVLATLAWRNTNKWGPAGIVLTILAGAVGAVTIAAIYQEGMGEIANQQNKLKDYGVYAVISCVPNEATAEAADAIAIVASQKSGTPIAVYLSACPDGRRFQVLGRALVPITIGPETADSSEVNRSDTPNSRMRETRPCADVHTRRTADSLPIC